MSGSSETLEQVQQYLKHSVEEAWRAISEPIRDNETIQDAYRKLQEGVSVVKEAINDPESMHGVYDQFAQDTYEQVHGAIDQALKNSGGLPVFVMSGEVHEDTEMDNTFNEYLPDQYENPALAAAYTHISAIHAAGELVGKENMVVSIELDQDTLDQEIHIAELELSGHRIMQQTPMYEAIRFAVEQGYEVVPSDPLHNTENPYAQERFEAEIEEIGKHALRTDNPPQVIVHIGGAYHIGSLQGYSISELKSDGETLTKNPERNPFEGIFGQTIFYSTSHTSPSMFVSEVMDDGAYYYQNRDNAIQIDPPGRMTEIDGLNIANQVLGHPVDTRSLVERMNDESYVPYRNEKDVGEILRELGQTEGLDAGAEEQLFQNIAPSAPLKP